MDGKEGRLSVIKPSGNQRGSPSAQSLKLLTVHLYFLCVTRININNGKSSCQVNILPVERRKPPARVYDGRFMPEYAREKAIRAFYE
jgi:hypothetical protein